MNKFFLTINLIILLILNSGCQTIKDKSDEVAAKENDRGFPCEDHTGREAMQRTRHLPQVHSRVIGGGQ